MTTKYTYKHYDAYTTEHAGTYPHTHWSSSPIDLYGCPGVTVHLQIYPNGDLTKQGRVGAFIHFNSIKPLITLDATTTIQISGKEVQKASQQLTVGKGCTIEFGEGYGWNSFCEMADIFQERKTTLFFSVTVHQMSVKNGATETITRPTGEQSTIHTSDGV